MSVEDIYESLNRIKKDIELVLLRFKSIDDANDQLSSIEFAKLVGIVNCFYN
jgi:hypothetical protein